MDTQKILKKYKAEKHKEMRKTLSGNAIIGEEVDENNVIHYVVLRDNEIAIEDYNTARPQFIMIPKPPRIIVNQ